MDVTVEKITHLSDLQEANSFTSGSASAMSLSSAYQCRHSPMRTQLFKVKMYGIPSFVSVHLVRHAAVGQLHFVQSMRTDRGGDGTEDRNSPVNHMMWLNAGHLIEMANARLCRKSSRETQEVMAMIAEEIATVDIDLALVMLPRCLEIGRCREIKTCGFFFNYNSIKTLDNPELLGLKVAP